MTDLPQNTCYICDKPLTDADSLVRHTYWKAQRCRIHKDCAEGFAAMVVECQTIDADCNDCKHFIRGAVVAKGISAATEGHCSKHDEPTVAMPGHASGYPCFEHRKG